MSTPFSKQRRKLFQEYSRVEMSYALFDVENIGMDLSELIGGIKETVAFSPGREYGAYMCMENIVLGVLESEGYSDETFARIGKAVISGAEKFENKRKKWSSDPKHKLFAEFTLVKNSLENVISPQEELGTEKEEIREGEYGFRIEI
ncbi:MAG: hypothetical protein R6U32_05145 [Candidatus Woesearchaeota archaeon]